MSDPTAHPNDSTTAPASERLAAVLGRIDAARESCGRAPGSVRLLAVSKTFSVQAMSEVLAAGQRDFGESYLQEALPKIAALRDRGACWHFIGPIQSNKTREIAAQFDWVHGIERLRIAQRLSDQRPPELAPLQVCVQVNISGEASKSGCGPAEAGELCRAIAALPRLALRGVMAIPAPAEDERDARAPYARLRRLFDEIKSTLPDEAAAKFDTISAGMSDDLEAAIAEGSTLVRIGTALFGERDYS
ncbi:MULTISPECIES: YggS family pyridoxal phosphate-dependent enzyme [Hydrocarboniphaga]|uniref:Pyridoxal phosphate homeostasis protein n=1 Tax=Hydrocarboniphaga effusa AP103 TaxID=1172194 RepID=I8T4B9_9GAMM|nr:MULTISPECIES: YggS family pyridoxal phosphate-dependent enzyme [Hydrocarboniphaga]EIT68538.1 Alanine racemase domain-containing protein [Hydrocarboniphaga effusa AP103]MDZ4077110.1 YggS family pyridoxal phosphate-dependent enzyme [Hydrocarboniphaga sp.]